MGFEGEKERGLMVVLAADGGEKDGSVGPADGGVDRTGEGLSVRCRSAVGRRVIRRGGLEPGMDVEWRSSLSLLLATEELVDAWLRWARRLIGLEGVVASGDSAMIADSRKRGGRSFASASPAMDPGSWSVQPR